MFQQKTHNKHNIIRILHKEFLRLKLIYNRRQVDRINPRKFVDIDTINFAEQQLTRLVLILKVFEFNILYLCLKRVVR